MNRFCCLCVVLMTVCGSVVLAAAQVEPSPAVVRGGAAPASLIMMLGQPHIEARAIERLYNDAVASDGSVEGILGYLSTAARDAARPKRQRANAWLVSSHVQWRHGSVTSALEAVDAGLAIDPSSDLLYQKAILLDASGETQQAKAWYEKTLAATRDPQLVETIRLRLTFIDAIDRHVDGLIALAKSRGRSFRNRAAIALGILDFNQEAASLYQLFGAGSERCRQHLRVAQWAIRAEDAAAAKAHAWSAVQTATLERDRRYGLSLLVEAHRLDDTLPELIARLSAKPALTQEEQRVRIELLRQTGQYDQAIAIFKRTTGGGVTEDLRHELLRMYRDAGQNDEMVAEYRRLIASEPRTTTWPAGLSQYYFEQGDQAGARRVWEDFVARNADVDTLLLGAQSMTSLGLHDLALAATDKAIDQAQGIAAMTKARFAQFDLQHRRGHDDEATAVLAALDDALPPDSDARAELAEAYERLERPHLAVAVWERLAASRGHLGVDERMRLAWLLDSIGRRDEALGMWREMWATETDSPRRRLVQDRLLILAAELGALGDLAIELEEKLAQGIAEPQDVSLLVAIYAKVGDSVSAIDALTEAAAQKPRSVSSEIASLKEQAHVYLALNEYQDFARVTQRLVELDSANKADHLQALLLNEVERGSSAGRDRPSTTRQMQSWLAQLRDVGGGAAGGEFAAGVMELAGLHDAAIDAYRRELARHPERADNHLLLADLLKQTGRRDQAVASLQYVTEAAGDDELFLVAIDGITNMQTGSASTLRWAIRRALERLTARDDKIYLYEVLAKLAEDTRDARTYVSALENSLAHANSRRAHVLRELLSTTGDSTLSGTAQGLHRPEPQRHAIYARRLIALGEELPPDVYTDLGRTFLQLKDPVNAMRAFDNAVDRSGRTSLVVDAAQRLDEGGYDREAIGQYEKALIADSHNVLAMYRLARLRQRTGLTDSANDLYLRTLLAIADRQPGEIERGTERTPPALDSVITFEQRRFSAYLMKGFLSTLPDASDARRSKLDMLEAAFVQELKRATAARESRPALLAYYPRLKVLARSVSWTLRAAGAFGMAERIAAALLQHFPGDQELRAEIDSDRDRWGGAVGVSSPDAASAPVSAADVMLRQAMERQDLGTAVGFRLARGHQSGTLAAYRKWIETAGLPKAPTRYGSIELRDAYGMAEVAAHARAHLDADHFRTLAEDISRLVSERDPYAEKLLRTPGIGGDVPILGEIERVLGRPLFSEAQLVRLLRRVDNWRVLCLTCALARLSVDRQLELLKRYVDAGDVNWSNFLSAVGVILSRPVDAAHAGRLLPILKGAFQTGLKRADAAWLPNFMNYRFTSNVHEQNAAIVEDMEQFIAERYPHAFNVGYFTAHLWRDLGRDDEAVAAFVKAALQMYAPETDGSMPPAGMPTSYAYKTFVRSFSSLIFPAHRSAVIALLDERDARDGPTEASVSVRVELHNNDPAGDQEHLLAVLRDLANQHPDSEPLLKTLFTLYDQRGQTADAVAVLTQLTRLHPENRLYRYRLLSAWQKLDHPEHALEVAGDDSVDELSRAVPRNPFIETLSGGPTARFPVLKRATDGIRAAAQDANQAARGLRSLLQALPPTGLPLTEFYRHNADGGEPYVTLRDLVTLNADGVTTRPQTPTGQSGNDRLVDALEVADANDPAKPPLRLLDAIVAYPFAADELERYLATLAAADIDRQYVFYARLVDAFARHGRAEEELEQRTTAVQAGAAGRKDLTVWLDLASRQPRTRALQLLEVAHERGITSSGALTAYQRVLLARLFARVGQRDEALATYNAVATAVIASSVNNAVPAGTGISADPYGRDNLLTLFTGLGLFEEVLQHLDEDAVRPFVTHLMAVSKAHATALLASVHERFVMALYLRALQAGLHLTVLDEAMRATSLADGWTRSDLVQSASVRVRLGQPEEASRLLQAALQREFDVAQPISPLPFDKQRAINAYAGVLGVSSATAFSPFAPPAVTGSTLEAFRVLFPARPDAWPGAAAWVARVARELPKWIIEQSVNRDGAVQVLVLVALRLHQLGEKDAMEAAVGHLSAVLSAGSGSVRAVTLAVSVTERIGTPIELSVAKALVREHRLDVSRVASVVARTAQIEGADAALQLGEQAARITSDPDLLAQLIAIAEASGREADRLRWVARQAAAANARTTLMRRPSSNRPS